MPSCLAFGCSNTSGKTQDVSYYQIPDPKKNRALASRWLHKTGNSKWNVNNLIPSRDRGVCSEHFHPNCLQRDLNSMETLLVEESAEELAEDSIL